MVLGLNYSILFVKWYNFVKNSNCCIMSYHKQSIKSKLVEIVCSLYSFTSWLVLGIPFIFSLKSRAFSMTAGERNSVVQISEPTATARFIIEIKRTVVINLIEVILLCFCNHWKSHLIVTVYFVVNRCETSFKNTMLTVTTCVTTALTEPHLLCWDANLRFTFR